MTMKTMITRTRKWFRFFFFDCCFFLFSPYEMFYNVTDQRHSILTFHDQMNVLVG